MHGDGMAGSSSGRSEGLLCRPCTAAAVAYEAGWLGVVGAQGSWGGNLVCPQRQQVCYARVQLSGSGPKQLPPLL